MLSYAARLFFRRRAAEILLKMKSSSNTATPTMMMSTTKAESPALASKLRTGAETASGRKPFFSAASVVPAGLSAALNLKT